MQPVLHRRFDMGNWFKRHGFPVDQIASAALQVGVLASGRCHRCQSFRPHGGDFLDLQRIARGDCISDVLIG